MREAAITQIKSDTTTIRLTLSDIGSDDKTDMINSIDWSKFTLEQSSRFDGGGSGTGVLCLVKTPPLQGIPVLRFVQVLEDFPEEARKIRDQKKPLPEDHPIRYAKFDNYYRAYSKDVPMFDNESKKPGNMELDVADMIEDESPRWVPPVSIFLTVSAGPSLPSVGMVNESDFIGHFFRGAGLGAYEVSGDVTAMTNALAYYFVDGHAADNGEEPNL